MKLFKSLFLGLGLVTSLTSHAIVIDNFDHIGPDGFTKETESTIFSSYDGTDSYLLKHSTGSGDLYLSWSVAGTIGGNRIFYTPLSTKGISYGHSETTGTFTMASNNGKKDTFGLIYNTVPTDISSEDYLGVRLYSDIFGGSDQKITWILKDSSGTLETAETTFSSTPSGWASGEWFSLYQNLSDFSTVDLTDIKTVAFVFDGVKSQDVTLDFLEINSVPVLEPSSLGLLGVGGVCMLLLRRKKG